MHHNAGEASDDEAHVHRRHVDVSTPFEQDQEDDLGVAAPVPRLKRKGTKGTELLSGITINSTELLTTEGLEESGEHTPEAQLEHRRIANPFYPALAVRELCPHAVDICYSVYIQ